MRSEGILKLSVKQIRFHGSILKMQLKLGLPTGFEAILFSITNIAIQSAVNTFGTDTTAAWSAYGKLDAIFWMVSTAFGIAITTFVGQNYGAEKWIAYAKVPRMPSYGFYCFRRTCCLSDRRTIPFIPVIYKRQSCN